MAKAKGKGEVPNKKSKSDRIEDIVDQQQQQQPHNDADDESDSVNNNNNNTSTDKKNKKPSKTTTSKKSSKSSADEGSSDEAKRNGRNGTTTTTTKQSTMGAMERAAAKRKSAKKANQSKTGGNEEDDRAITPDTTVSNNNNNNKTDETKNKNKIDEDVDSDDDVFVKKEPKPATPGSRLHGIIWIVVVVSILILTIALRIGEDVYTNTRAYTGEEPQFIDYYATLEVPKTATAEEIKKAYRKLAIKWHPDRNPDCGKKCEDKVSELSEAYDVLSYPDTRKFHDTYGVKPPPNLLKLAKMKHGGSARNRKGGGDE